jgi:hypothetical protein
VLGDEPVIQTAPNRMLSPKRSDQPTGPIEGGGLALIEIQGG